MSRISPGFRRWMGIMFIIMPLTFFIFYICRVLPGAINRRPSRGRNVLGCASGRCGVLHWLRHLSRHTGKLPAHYHATTVGNIRDQSYDFARWAFGFISPGSAGAGVRVCILVGQHCDWYLGGTHLRSFGYSLAIPLTTVMDIDLITVRTYYADIGKFLNQDRFKDKYPSMSPYQYAALNPISFIDVNGDSVDVSHLNEYTRSWLISHLTHITGVQLEVNARGILVG